MAKWLPPNGFAGNDHRIDAKVRGAYEGIPEVIPTESCYLGSQDSLMLLAKLVEAEIPG